MKKIQYVLLLVVLLLVALAILVLQRADDDIKTLSIRLGVLYALTGPAAPFGELSVQGVRDAVQYFEEQNDIPVVLYVEDTAGDPTTAVSAATKLFSVEDIDFAVVGMSAVSSAITPLADSYESLVISDAAVVGLTDDAEYMFQNFVPTLYDIPLQLNNNETWERVALVYINDEFGGTWKDEIVQHTHKDVSAFPFEAGATDFRTDALKIRSYDPDAVVVLGYGPGLNQVFSDLATQNVDAPYITYLSCTLPGVLTDERYDLEGMYSYEYPSIAESTIGEWVTAHTESPSTFYTLAFENTLVALTVAMQSGQDSATASELVKTQSFDGLYGAVSFAEEGVVTRDLALRRIANGHCDSL